MLLFKSFAVFCIISGIFASPLKKDRQAHPPDKIESLDSTNANAYVDELLARARPLIQEKLEPVELPEYSLKISQSIIITDVEAEAKVHDGWLAGLTTLHRAGDAILSTTTDKKTISISTTLGVSNIAGHYRGEVTFMNLGPSVQVHLSVRSLTVEVGVGQSMYGNTKSDPILTHFDIKNLGEIDFEFDGLGPLDWIINPFTNFLLNKIRGVIAWVVEFPLRHIIANLLPAIKMPKSY